MKFTRTDLVLGTTRLLEMCRFMDRVPEHKFDFEHIVSNVESHRHIKEGLKAVSCGTRACIIGWSPVFFNQSLNYECYGHRTVEYSNPQKYLSSKYTDLSILARNSRTTASDFKVMMDFFSLYPWELRMLFVPKYQIYDDNSEVETKEEVVEQIREFCRCRIQTIKKMPLAVKPKRNSARAEKPANAEVMVLV